jgi:hypothetical protein
MVELANQEQELVNTLLQTAERLLVMEQKTNVSVMLKANNSAKAA